MEIHHIKNIEDKWFNDFYAIYSVSFPDYEQRNREQQIAAFNNERYHLIVFIKNNQINSFIAYWEFKEYIYIEHLAVDPKLRGQNLGRKMMHDFAEDISKNILLEIDPLTNDIAKRRFKFYEKIGYKKNPYIHFHPAYNPELKPHELVVLSYPDHISLEEYKDFNNDLKSIVMNM